MVAVDYATLKDYLRNIILYKELSYIIIVDRDDNNVISLGRQKSRSHPEIDTHPAEVHDGIFDITEDIHVADEIMGRVLMGFSLSIFTDVLILIIIMVILGMSTFLTYPAIFSYVSEKTDEAYEGKVFGYLFTVQLGGGTFLLFISGVTSDIWGIWTPFFILGVLSILISILLIGNQKKLVPVKT